MSTEQRFILDPDDKNRAGILDNLIAFARSLPDTKAWDWTCKPLAKDRSGKQNRSLWGVAYPALRAATGQGVNDWHEYMLGEHFGWIESTLFGKRKAKPARTTTTGYDGESSMLSTVEFAEYYNFIQRRGRENGVFIPDPDPLWHRYRGGD